MVSMVYRLHELMQVDANRCEIVRDHYLCESGIVLRLNKNRNISRGRNIYRIRKNNVQHACDFFSSVNGCTIGCHIAFQHLSFGFRRISIRQKKGKREREREREREGGES